MTEIVWVRDEVVEVVELAAQAARPTPPLREFVEVDGRLGSSWSTSSPWGEWFRAHAESGFARTRRVCSTMRCGVRPSSRTGGPSTTSAPLTTLAMRWSGTLPPRFRRATGH